MAATVQSFLVLCPEFANTGIGLIQAAIAAAALQIDPVIWGPKADYGTIMLAAHNLAMSPSGQASRLVVWSAINGTVKEPTTTYHQQYLRLMRQVAFGYRVT